MHRPPTLRPSRRQPPPRTGVLRARLLRPAGRHAMVVAHFFESGSDAVYVGAESRAHANAGAVALASTGYIAAIDEKPGRGHVGSAGVQGSPQREPALPTETAREQNARRKVESSFWSGVDRSPVARRDRLSRRTYPEELRRLLVLRVSIALPLRSTMIYRTSPKISGCLRSNVIRTY